MWARLQQYAPKLAAMVMETGANMFKKAVVLAPRTPPPMMPSSKMGKFGLATGGIIVLHQLLTHREHQHLEQLEPKGDQPPKFDGNVILILRATPAFVLHRLNPMRHVFLTIKTDTTPERRIAERGAGREDWASVSQVKASMSITPEQAALLEESNQLMTTHYNPIMYGPGHNDCHTWIHMVQKQARIPNPLTTPRIEVLDDPKPKTAES